MRNFIFVLNCLLAGCGRPWDFQGSASGHNISSTPMALEETNSKQGWFKIVILNVGQGDATLLIAPEGETVLIDTGPRETGVKAVEMVLKEMGIGAPQTVFISHDHEDHTGGLKELLKNWEDDPKILDKTNTKVGQTILLGSVTIQIKAANGQIGETMIPPEARIDENNLSLALLIEYGTFRYFTEGDLPGGGGTPPYDTLDLESVLAPLVGDVDVILVSHHGSHTSTNETFLQHLKPEVAVISVGDKNEFFHPHLSTIKRLKEAGVKLYQTQRGSLLKTDGIDVMNDHICIVTDGENYFVKPYSVDKCAGASVE